jgi:hypothetical protein
VQKLCFDHALAYVELFFPGTIEKYQARLPHWQRNTSHLWSVAGRPSRAPLKPQPEVAGKDARSDGEAVQEPLAVALSSTSETRQNMQPRGF